MSDEDGIQINELAFVVLHLGYTQRLLADIWFRLLYSSQVQRIEVPDFVSSLSLSQRYAKNGITSSYSIFYLFCSLSRLETACLKILCATQRFLFTIANAHFPALNPESRKSISDTELGRSSRRIPSFLGWLGRDLWDARRGVCRFRQLDR